jgi:hypothetical protein
MVTTTMSPQHHKFWLQDEERRLRFLVETDMSLEEAAQLFGRSRNAIVEKVKRLDLRIPEGWRVRRQTTKGAFQALSWVHGLLSDVKDLKDLERTRVQVDKALETLSKSAVEDFKQNLKPERMQ